MHPIHGESSPAVMSIESLSVLGDGISLVLSRWPALQTAIRNEWGGRDSRRKSDELASTILSWFAHSRVPIYIDDLESILDENMMLSFNTEIEDGSVEEVAEQLMIMHEECLQGNYESIDTLRKSVNTKSVSQSRRWKEQLEAKARLRDKHLLGEGKA